MKDVPVIAIVDADASVCRSLHRLVYSAGYTVETFASAREQAPRRSGGAARNLRRARVPENVCMAITGHKTRSIFDRYSIVDEHDIAEALTVVQAHVQAQPVERTVVPITKAAEGRRR